MSLPALRNGDGDSFTPGCAGNFNARKVAFFDSILRWGDPALELIHNKRILSVEPTIYVMDSSGSPLYALVYMPAIGSPGDIAYVPSSGTSGQEDFVEAIGSPGDVAYVPPRYGPDLTASSDLRFSARHASWMAARVRRDSDSRELMAYLLSCLSSASNESLSTYDSYDTSKFSCDVFAVWQLVLQTHQFGSSRTKHRYLADFLGFKQGKLSYDAYIGELRARFDLVMGVYASSEFPGYLSADLIMKAVFMQGLDPVYFERPIARLMDDLPMSTAREAIDLCQHFALDRGPVVSVSFVSVSLVDYQSKALVADTDLSLRALAVNSQGRVSCSSLGVWSKASKFCEFCWNNGFNKVPVNVHSKAQCPFRLRRLARDAEFRAVSSIVSPSSSALLASTSTVSSSRSPTLGDDANYHRDIILLLMGYLARLLSSDILLSSVNVEDGACVSLLFAVPAVDWWYDNAASVSICSDLAMLDDSVRLSEPFRLGGIVDGVLVTHRACLVSCAFIQSQGGAYASVGLNQLRISDRDGVVIDVATMGVNRLTAVSPILVQSVYSCKSPSIARLALSVSSSSIVPLLPSGDDDSDFSLPPLILVGDVACLTPKVLSFAGLCDDELRAVFAGVSQLLAIDLAFAHGVAHPPGYVDPPFPAGFAFPAGFEHVSAEQRARCDRVELVHYFIHVHDDVLCQALDGGAYSWADITPADVRLNRRLRGKCVQCLEGKFEDKSMPSSHTPPASAVGMLISFDTQELLEKSSGGNQCYIDSIDEFSGDLQVTPAKSLSAVNIFNAVMSLVYTRYNAYGHRVTHMVADSLPALEPVIPMLGAMGILLTLCPPGQHAQRIERSVGYSAGRRRSVLCGLPYVLPLKYELYAMAWMADHANNLPNIHSAPSTAGWFCVEHYKFSQLRFGHVCMVSMFEVKRRREASDLSMLLKDVQRSELGVCLGYSRSTPGAFDFLVVNGSIVPHAVVKIVNVHPFDWKVRKVLNAKLAVLCCWFVRICAFSFSSFYSSPSFSHPSLASDNTSVVSAASSSYVDVPSGVVSADASLPLVVVPSLSDDAVSSVSSVLSDEVPWSPPHSRHRRKGIAVPVVAVSPPPVITRSGRVVHPPGWRDMSLIVNDSVHVAVAPLAVDFLAGQYASSSSSFIVAESVSPASSILLLTPSTKCKEVPLRQALRARDVARLELSTAIEVSKQRRLGALGKDFSESQVPVGAIIVDAIIADDRDTCRIAAMGDRCPPKL
eukprot:gene34581-44707_t